MSQNAIFLNFRLYQSLLSHFLIFYFAFFSFVLFSYQNLQKKPDWSKGKPGDAKVKEEADGVEA